MRILVRNGKLEALKRIEIEKACDSVQFVLPAVCRYYELISVYQHPLHGTMEINSYATVFGN